MEVQGKYVSRDHICIRGEDGYKKHMQIRNNIHNEIWPCPISGCSRFGIGGQRHGNRYIIACTTYEQKLPHGMCVFRSALFFSFFFPLVSFPSSPLRPTLGLLLSLNLQMWVGDVLCRTCRELTGEVAARSYSLLLVPKVSYDGGSSTSPADGRLMSLSSPSTVLTPGELALRTKWQGTRESHTGCVRLSRR